MFLLPAGAGLVGLAAGVGMALASLGDCVPMLGELFARSSLEGRRFELGWLIGALALSAILSAFSVRVLRGGGIARAALMLHVFVLWVGALALPTLLLVEHANNLSGGECVAQVSPAVLMLFCAALLASVIGCVGLVAVSASMRPRASA